jgi:peptidoglycan/LPS O-acetylase OafA/YrhL
MSLQPGRLPSFKYRPDVDGLRAVAVLLVIAGHLRTRVTGGYVGVDVFFVISGYLISATILSELAQGKFSIVNFYERRIRRIFPAMLVMMAVVSFLAYRYFVPSEVEAYAKSLLAALFSGSNFLFWHDAGYFDAQSELKPMLHTWSLAVEEQFYIFFPIFLILIRRWFPERMKTAIWGVAFVSLAAASVIVIHNPVAAFFFAPLRAWELLAGTIVSQHYLPQLKSAVSRNIASGLGLLLILVPALTYSSATMFPGLGALPPVLGAALIIAAGETGSSAVGKLLAWRPVVFIGLISYSLYLWHWPIIVFQDTSSILLPGIAITTRAKLLIALVSIVVGALSWKFIEQPFRKGRFRPSRRGVFAVNGIVLAVMSLIGVLMVWSHGLPGRFPEDARKIAAYTTYDEKTLYRQGVCFLENGTQLASFNKQVCLGEPNGKRSLLILGDSHGAQLWPGLSTVFADRQVMQANTTGCRPTVVASDGHQTGICKDLFGFMYNDFLMKNHVDTVLIAGRWVDGDMPALTKTIEFAKAHGIAVVVVGPGLEFDMPEPRVVALELRSGRPERIDAFRLAQPRATDQKMTELARDVWHVPYISQYADLCTPECPVYASPGVPMLFDTDHLTAEGSVLLAKVIREKNELP